jgi:hypothetical protein
MGTALNGFKLEVLEVVFCSQLSLSHHHDFISTAFSSCVRLCILCIYERCRSWRVHMAICVSAIIALVSLCVCVYNLSTSGATDRRRTLAVAWASRVVCAT